MLQAPINWNIIRSLAKTDDPDRNIDRFEVNGTLIDDPKTIAYK